MAVGAKCIETRHWPTHVRGEVAIHAAKRKVKSELEEYWEDDAFRNALLPMTIGKGNLADSLPFGAIVAVVYLYDCRSSDSLKKDVPDWISAEEHFGNFEPGRYGWLTRGPQILTNPVETRGFQGFWDLPSDIEARVRAQI
jgi:hypothetical protein